jgi:diacylglycerol kinase family enzyme
MRAWLIVNPASTSVRPRLRTDVASALKGRQGPRAKGKTRLDLTVVHTSHRGHASRLAREAAEAGAGLIVVMGGDGTVNEVLNGMAGAQGSAVPRDAPMLGLVGGGKTNVFARALGLPGQPLKAANALLALLDSEERRHISVGEANGRRFAVGAGLGLDGAIVREVERQRRVNRIHDDRVYVLAGLRAVAQWDRSRPRLRLELGDRAGAAEGLDGREPPPPIPGYFAIASNGDPYTYLGPRPFRPTPEARFEGGLDLLAGQSMAPAVLTRAIAGMLAGRALPPFPGLPVFHDYERARMVSEVPLPFQVDGEYLGDVTEVGVRRWADALTVVAPREATRSRRPVLAPWWSATRPVWRPGPWRRDGAGAAEGGLADAMPGSRPGRVHEEPWQ